MDLKKYTYIEEFGGKFEMIVCNIEYDRIFIVPAVCPGGSKEEEIDMDFVYYMLEDGRWKIKVKGLRNREGTAEKWNFFMELNEEDAKSAWDRRKEILKKGYVKKRQYPDEFLEMMARESRIIMASEEARRTRFNEYMQDELQLLGEILPGEGDGLPDLDYLPTTPEDEVAAGGEQDGEVPQRVGEEGQHGEADEGSEERYPPPSDAADSDCRGRMETVMYQEYLSLEISPQKRSWKSCMVPEKKGKQCSERLRCVMSKCDNKNNKKEIQKMLKWKEQIYLRLLLHLRVWRSRVSSATCWTSFEME